MPQSISLEMLQALETFWSIKMSSLQSLKLFRESQKMADTLLHDQAQI